MFLIYNNYKLLRVHCTLLNFPHFENRMIFTLCSDSKRRLLNRYLIRRKYNDDQSGVIIIEIALSVLGIVLYTKITGYSFPASFVLVFE